MISKPLTPIGLFIEGFNWTGKSGRLQLLVVMIPTWVLIGTMLFFNPWLNGLPRYAKPLVFLGLSVVYIPSVGHQLRRLNDLGWSGWWFWLSNIAVINVVYFALLIFKPGKSGSATLVWSSFRRAGFVAAVGVSLVAMSRTYWIPFWIPSGSMKPTFLIGDYLTVAPYFGEPARGDVIVFRHPVTGVDFIQRLIGLPGDRVQLREGNVYINEAVAPQVDAGRFTEVMEPQGPMAQIPRCENGTVGMGAECTSSRSRETLPNGVEHYVLNIDSNIAPADGSFDADNTDVYTVPEGMYFLLGDHRDNSIDSRFPQAARGVGFVPLEDIVGRADRIMFSSAGTSMLAFWTWRSDRYLKAVE